MKPILRNNKKFSFKLLAIFFFVELLMILSFYFSLKYAGDSKKSPPELKSSATIQPPSCNKDSGFYPGNFDLELKAADENAMIYYTLDGSEPKLSSFVYLDHIKIKDRSSERNVFSAIPTSPRWKPPVENVFKGTVVRAISVDANNRKSKEMVRTFFISRNARKRYTLPVISIVMNSKDLFGYNNGIYVLGKTYTDKDNYIKKKLPLDLPWWQYPSNYLERGMDSERPAHLQFIETNGEIGFSAYAGVRIHGNATRGYAQKSLRVSFRKEYGPSELNYDIFSNNKNYRLSSFILRNSGNDWDKTMFRDALMQTLMKNSKIDIQDYRPSVVFINGEYWGIHNIRERFDEYYISGKYDVSPDSVTILELNGKRISGEKTDELDFSDLLSYVKKNDLSNNENYSYVAAKIDIGSFQDFIIANVFFCNSDWPNNNVRFWKYNGEENDSLGLALKKWHWMLYDTDWGFGFNAMSGPEINLLTKAMNVGSSGILFKALNNNSEFRSSFLLRFQELLNTKLSSDEMIKKIDTLQSAIAPEMKEHIFRWRSISSYDSWLKNVEVLRDFARRRPKYQIDQLNSFYGLEGMAQIKLKK